MTNSTEKKYSDAEIELRAEQLSERGWPSTETADMFRQLLAERNERQTVQISADPVDKGCSCNDPRCGYDAHYGNPLRSAQSNQPQAASHSARGTVSDDEVRTAYAIYDPVGAEVLGGDSRCDAYARMRDALEAYEAGRGKSESDVPDDTEEVAASLSDDAEVVRRQLGPDNEVSENMERASAILEMFLATAKPAPESTPVASSIGGTKPVASTETPDAVDKTAPESARVPDYHCKECGTHEVSVALTCHNSGCSEYASEHEIHRGWENTLLAAAPKPEAQS